MANMALTEALEVLENHDRVDPGVIRSVLMRRDLPTEALVRAAALADSSIRASAVARPGMPIDVVVRLAADPSWQVRVEVARRPDCPEAALGQLANDTDPFVRRTAFVHPHLGIREVLRVLTEGKSRLDAGFVARHPSLDCEQHLQTLMSATEFGAHALLTRTDLPGALVGRFAESDRPTLTRLSAVTHNGCPPDTLGRCARVDPDVDIRVAAVSCKACPPLALVAAASDPEMEVRRACAGNVNCPEAATSILMHDIDPSVRKRAAARASVPPELLALAVRTDPDSGVRAAAVSNPLCPGEVLIEECSKLPLVFEAAGNESCPREGLFAALVTIRDFRREGLPRGSGNKRERRRQNKVQTLAKKCGLSLSGWSWEWLAAQRLEEIHPEDLMLVLGRHLRQAAGDPRVQIRIAVAQHPDVGDGELAVLAGDENLEVRRAVSDRILGAAGADSSADE